MDSPAPLRRALKRSASTASLLTPPRTYRRRGRGRSRGSCDSDSNSGHGGSDSSDDDEEHNTHRKKRKLDTRFAQDDGDEEAQFWGGGEASKSEEEPKPSTSRPTRPLLYQRFKTRSGSSAVSLERGLVSPPPSNRKTGNAPTALVPTSPSPATTASLPVTPKPKSKQRNGGSASNVPLLIDSPSNPFAATPAGDADQVESPANLTEGDESPTPVYDKPTVTYVFRGVRRVYQNPAFDHAKNRPLSPPPNSRLPLDDPAFSPDPTCKPRLLFPEAHKKRKGRKVAPAVQSSSKRVLDSDSEGEVSIEQTLAKGCQQPTFKRPMTLDAELKRAAAKAQLDDDPFC